MTPTTTPSTDDVLAKTVFGTPRLFYDFDYEGSPTRVVLLVCAEDEQLFNAALTRSKDLISGTSAFWASEDSAFKDYQYFSDRRLWHVISLKRCDENAVRQAVNVAQAVLDEKGEAFAGWGTTVSTLNRYNRHLGQLTQFVYDNVRTQALAHKLWQQQRGRNR